ncbi:SH3 domain-containing protein [Sphingomonas glaciei]|uniref:SH3 domain-containing protein n=1 Tax=Sphingomonas glaciei TaxID=2938948 RepID=A0ABY5MXM3_9SPHN|nr:SH3 domain-containing protein [Sphingomonas glaciei]UUR09200.1 SH3 domain-containing protein [Sphingomonas glaciei]
MKRLAGLALLGLAASASAQDRPVPYWASIQSGEAMMRTGPARTYPGIWLYKRRDLPIRVLKLHENWRLIEDSEGTRGWMLRTMLSDTRTAIVRGSAPRPVHTKADEGSRVRYLAQPGVVGRIDDCSEGWCHIKIGNREGHIKVADLWGVEPGETVED